MVLVAEIPLQPRPLVEVQRHAFVIVIGEVVGDELRGLVDRQQALHALAPPFRQPCEGA